MSTPLGDLQTLMLENMFQVRRPIDNQACLTIRTRFEMEKSTDSNGHNFSIDRWRTPAISWSKGGKSHFVIQRELRGESASNNNSIIANITGFEILGGLCAENI